MKTKDFESMSITTYATDGEGVKLPKYTAHFEFASMGELNKFLAWAMTETHIVTESINANKNIKI